jgi:hypothetical protein
MPSLSDFGLGPEAPASERRRARVHVDDESGARPLPSGALDPEPLDERIELPGVSRSDAAIYFGIGAGLGVAALSIVAALYFGGYLDRPVLDPAPATTALEPEARLAPLKEANDAEAIAFARVADAKLAAPPVFAPPPAVEAPDISVTEMPAAPSASEELEDLDRAQPTPMPTPREPPLPPPAQPTAPAEMPRENPY